MDILRKMFSKTNEDVDGRGDNKDEFRKPTWLDDDESEDELFDSERKFLFQIFTNPIELQKHFDHQMKEIIKSMKEFEDTGHHSPKEEYLKPGFEKDFIEEFQKNSKGLDTDLDGEIYADQLHSLLQRITPEVKQMLPRNDTKQQQSNQKKKLSDIDTIMGKIHGTIVDEESTPVNRRKDVPVPRMPPHFGGVFEGTYQGPRMFGQSIMSQTIRKPDGTYETKKVIRDSDGSTKTVITRFVDGKPETTVTYDGNPNEKKSSMFSAIKPKQEVVESEIPSDRNIYVSKQGYALPKNLW